MGEWLTKFWKKPEVKQETIVILNLASILMQIKKQNTNMKQKA